MGKNRFQAALIIEPDWTSLGDIKYTPEAFLEEIWPTVKKANETLPAPGWISQLKIVSAVADQLFKRLSKGTIIRQATAQLYEDELATLHMSEEFTYECSEPTKGPDDT